MIKTSSTGFVAWIEAKIPMVVFILDWASYKRRARAENSGIYSRNCNAEAQLIRIPAGFINRSAKYNN